MCSSFLVSRASRVALIIQISKVLSELKLFLVSYMVSYLGLGSVLSIELVLDLGLGSLSILFIVEYQFSQYFYILSLSFYLVWGVVVRVSLYSYILFPGSWWTLVEILYLWNLVEFSGRWNLVEFLGRWNQVDFLGIGWTLVEILNQQILVDFSDFGLESKQQVVRHFCL